MSPEKIIKETMTFFLFLYTSCDEIRFWILHKEPFDYNAILFFANSNTDLSHWEKVGLLNMDC